MYGIASGPHSTMPASFEPSSGCAWLSASSPVGVRLARPLRVLGERLRGRVEVHRAHPQAELHRGDRLADGGEGGVGVAGRRAARLGELGRIGLPVAGARLPAVVEHERVGAEAAGAVGDALDHRERGVVLRAAAVVVEAVGVDDDAAGLAGQAVLAQVARELPLGVAVAVAEADEDGVERERLAGARGAVPGGHVARVLDVPALLERAEDDDVAAVVGAQRGGGAVVGAAGRREVGPLGDEEEVAAAVADVQPLGAAGERLAAAGGLRVAPRAGVRVADLELGAGPLGVAPVRARAQRVQRRRRRAGGRLLEHGAADRDAGERLEDGLGAEAGDAGIGLDDALDGQAGDAGEGHRQPDAAAGQVGRGPRA